MTECPEAIPPSLNHETQSEFSPAMRTAGRIVAAVGGVTAGLAMFVVGGLLAALNSCTGYAADAATCGGLDGLVDTLDLLCVLGGAAAALAGGIATAATGHARWIAGGMAITIVCVVALSVLVGMQETALN
ncbi:MAG: hypothetical protein Q8K79_20765 [Solirubrobacteraceae bacterium]|nr:hypothetical protein [Solirubrobacteraceae bacterium]